MAVFPLFFELQGRRVLVVGAGAVGARRIAALEEFGADLTVVSCEVRPEIRKLAAEGRIRLFKGRYEDWRERLDREEPFFLVLAASGNQADALAGEDAKRRGSFFNLANDRLRSDFYFPGIARFGALTAGIVGDGADHALTRRAAGELRRFLRAAGAPTGAAAGSELPDTASFRIRVASRESALAIAQSRLAMQALQALCPQAKLELIPMKTKGDRIQDRPLDEIGGRGLFVGELDRALREERCDLTVHSLKDMPLHTPEELPVLACLPREDCRDVLVLRRDLAALPASPVIGTSSRRRQIQGKRLFPDAVWKPVRGNILTRLKKLDDGEYDALILAAAGLKRLGLSDRISRFLEITEMIPAAGQGILAVQGRRDGWDFVRDIDDAASRAMAEAEQSFVRALGGGCSLPTAAVSVIRDGILELTGFYYDEKSGEGKTETLAGEPADAAGLGRRLAARVKGGAVYLVGAGPGDAGLLTVRARTLLERADTVVYDALAGTGVLGLIPKEAEAIDVGKRSGRHSCPQEEIQQILIQKAREGKQVVRLKGGDPFLFGRGGEEAQALKQAGIPFEVVPGVSASLAVPAWAGIPVTHRGLSSCVHILTGHRAAPAGPGRAQDPEKKGTVCVLMGVSEAEAICRGLIEGGMDPQTPAAFIQDGTLASEKTVFSVLDRLAEDAKKAGIRAPALLIAGKVCRLAGECSWAGTRPLAGLRIVTTRPRDRDPALAERLRDGGAEVLELPAIEIAPLGENGEENPDLDRALSRLECFDWLVFTSPSGVACFFDGLSRRRLDLRRLFHLRIAAIGHGTEAELKKRGLFADYLPQTAYAGELGRGLARLAGREERILICRARDGSPALTDALSAAGCLFEEVALYETRMAGSGPLSRRIGALLSEDGIDLVLFTSASTVRGFLGLMGEKVRPGRLTAACIGRETERAAREAGFGQILTAETPSAESLGDCIFQWAKRRRTDTP